MKNASKIFGASSICILFFTVILAGCTISTRRQEETEELLIPSIIEDTDVLENKPSQQQRSISMPPPGQFYHGVYPGGISGAESDLTIEDLRSYETAAGKKAAWVFFSHNWYEGHAFPFSTSEWIHQAGSVPYIRLMMWSKWEQNTSDPSYSLQKIIDGQFDTDLHAWCAAALNFGTPLIAEYGVEVNGEWFPWNGVWHGGGETSGYGDPDFPDGPERYRDAYRHIIDICRSQGAYNITWVFHANYDDWPNEDWNRLENYYPGDEWVDWIAVSVYGAQRPMDNYWDTFRENMDVGYARLETLSISDPIILAEFGVTKNHQYGDQAEWAREALIDITSQRWPRLIGFSWWNERWQNDNDPMHDTTMRLQDNPDLAETFQKYVGDNRNVLGSLEY